MLISDVMKSIGPHGGARPANGSFSIAGLAEACEKHLTHLAGCEIDNVTMHFDSALLRFPCFSGFSDFSTSVTGTTSSGVSGTEDDRSYSQVSGSSESASRYRHGRRRKDEVSTGSSRSVSSVSDTVSDRGARRDPNVSISADEVFSQITDDTLDAIERSEVRQRVFSSS